MAFVRRIHRRHHLVFGRSALVHNNNRNPNRETMLQIFKAVYVSIWKRGGIWGRDLQHDSKYILDTYYRHPYGYI